MKLTITKILALAFMNLSLVSCGVFDDESEVKVQMYGVAQAPDGATGDTDPQFQTYEVQSIVLRSAEGDVTLLDTATSFKIVDRPQILLSRSADDLAGRSFTEVDVSFSPTVQGGDKDNPDLSFTLSTTDLSLVQAITLKDGQGLNLTVKVNWANTIGQGAMSEPTLELTAD